MITYLRLLFYRINHFKHSVGAPLHGTEAFPTRQSQIQRFMKAVSREKDCTNAVRSQFSADNVFFVSH